jgi:hypothetical protein
MEGTDYSLDYVVARLGRLNSVLHQGSRDQQKRALGLLLQRIWVDLEGNVKEVVLQDWAQPLFVDLIAMLGDQIRPQGTSNARHVATLAGLKTHSMSIPQPVKSAKPLRATFLHPQSDQSATLTPEAIARNPSLN